MLTSGYHKYIHMYTNIKTTVDKVILELSSGLFVQPLSLLNLFPDLACYPGLLSSELSQPVVTGDKVLWNQIGEYPLSVLLGDT